MDRLRTMSREALINKVQRLEEDRNLLQQRLDDISSETLLTRVLDALPCPVIMKNEDLEVTYLNAELRKLVPLPPRHLGQAILEQIFPAPILSRAAASDLEVLRTGRPQQREEFFCGLGIKGWFLLLKGRFICPVTGRKLILVQVQDTSALRRTQKHLRRTQRIAKLGSWQLRRPENTLICSEGAFTLFGYDPSEVTPTPALFWDHVHPQDRIRIRKGLKSFRPGDPPYSCELRIQRNDGQMRWLRMHVITSTSSRSDLPHLDGIFQDITEQKQLQEKQEAIARDLALQQKLFATMADNLSDMLWAKDLENKYLFGNKAIREKLLHSDDISIRGRQDIFFAERQRAQGWQHTFGECCMNSDDVVLKTCRPGVFIEDGMIRNEYVMLEVHKSALYDSEGNLIGTVGTARDITEQKRAEKELVAAKDAAEAAVRAKSTFLANIGHEIRTPLNGLLGLLDVTLRSRISPEQQDNLTQARTSAVRLLRLLQNVTECADLEQGRLSVEMQEFDPDEAVSECCARVQKQCKDKKINLDVRISDDARPPVLGDRTKVQRILDLVLDNAVKFTQQGTVAITASRDADHPGILEFHIRDTGCGIPEDSLEKIFSSFTQVEDGLNRSHEGAGLGLSIAKKLVDLLRGSITAFSRPGETDLRIRIPLAAVVPNETTDPPTLPPRTLSILVVDDNMVNRMVLQKTLQQEHHQVLTAATGKEAVDRFRQNRFDLILMDIQMPEMNGIDATRAIRGLERNTSEPGVPVIAVTANALSEERERFLQAGMDELILKPVSRARLMAIVDDIIGTKKGK